jgi:hypothetical protein
MTVKVYKGNDRKNCYLFPSLDECRSAYETFRYKMIPDYKMMYYMASYLLKSGVSYIINEDQIWFNYEQVTLLLDIDTKSTMKAILWKYGNNIDYIEYVKCFKKIVECDRFNIKKMALNPVALWIYVTNSNCSMFDDIEMVYNLNLSK